jgi:hypothetical protein
MVASQHTSQDNDAAAQQTNQDMVAAQQANQDNVVEGENVIPA